MDYEKALSTNPANPFAWKGLARIHRCRGKYDEAMICLRKCVFFYEKSGTQNHAWPELIAEQAEIYFCWAIRKWRNSFTGDTVR